MTTYRELLAQIKTEIDEIGTPETNVRLQNGGDPLLLDVREPDEWHEGHLPGAVHVPRGNLESLINEGVLGGESRRRRLLRDGLVIAEVA